MGDDDRKHPGGRNRRERAADSHPQTNSSTSRAALPTRLRGVGAFPANTEIARTIASLRGLSGVEPLGHALAAIADSTGGVSFVQGHSCGHPSSALQV
jgi:hypothetical protein